MSLRKTFFQRLRDNVSGVAMTELALSLPFFLTAGLWGVELANYGVVNMKMSQLAIHIADNASRIGDTSMLEDRKIYEADIDDLLLGAGLQSGSLALFDHGRIIISSLEVDEDENQYIHWQRCLGMKEWDSSYGDVNDTLPNGMGPTGEEVISFPGEAVMFVELAYDYQPLVSARFVGTPEIKSIASFTVRSDRDLTQIYQRDPGSPDPVADCAVNTNLDGLMGSGGGGGSPGGGPPGGGPPGGGPPGGGPPGG